MARRHAGKSAAVGAILAIGSGVVSAAQFEYTLDAGVEDNDNIALTPTDQIDRQFLRMGLGFTFDERTSAIQASVTGRIEYRDYRSAQFDNSADGSLDGRFNWIAIPQRLHLVVEDNLSVQPVSRLAPDTPTNRQQVNVFSLGPTLFFRSGETVHGQAELRYIHSDAEVTDDFNSQRVGTALRLVKDLDPTSLVSLNLQGQRVDFDNDVVARDYDLLAAYLRYARTLNHFDLGLEGGYSQLRYRDGQRRNEPLLRGDLTWRFSERSQFDLSASSQISDSASAALTDLMPGTEVPDSVLIGNALVTTSAYREKRLELGYTWTGTRVGITLAPYYEDRDYIDAGELDQELRGGRFNLNWRLRRLLTLNLFARQEDSDFSTIDRTDETRYFGIGLQKDFSRHWSSRLDWTRYERDSTVAGQDVSQNIWYLSVIYRNR